MLMGITMLMLCSGSSLMDGVPTDVEILICWYLDKLVII